MTIAEGQPFIRRKRGVNLYELIRPKLEFVKETVGEPNNPRLSIKLTPSYYEAEEKNPEVPNRARAHVYDKFKLLVNDDTSAKFLAKAYFHAGFLFLLCKREIMSREEALEILVKDELDLIFTAADIVVSYGDYTIGLKNIISRYEFCGRTVDMVRESYRVPGSPIVHSSPIKVSTKGKDLSYVELGYPLEHNVSVLIS